MEVVAEPEDCGIQTQVVRCHLNSDIDHREVSKILLNCCEQFSPYLHVFPLRGQFVFGQLFIVMHEYLDEKHGLFCLVVLQINLIDHVLKDSVGVKHVFVIDIGLGQIGHVQRQVGVEVSVEAVLVDPFTDEIVDLPIIHSDRVLLRSGDPWYADEVEDGEDLPYDRR